MPSDRHLLAAHGPPESTMVEYSVDELRDPARVEELFDYCQILQGVITAQGWKHLLETHGLAGLLEIDRRSGWLDADESEAADALKYQCLISGYDPETDRFGAYDETSGAFTNKDGTTRTVRWGARWAPPAPA